MVLFGQDHTDGHYVLDCDNPVHKAVLMDLCYLESEQKIPQATIKLRINGRPLKGGKKKSSPSMSSLNWPRDMPYHGTVDLEYALPLLRQVIHGGGVTSVDID